MEQLPVRSSPDFINDSWLQINKYRSRHMLACAGLTEEGVESIVPNAHCSITANTLKSISFLLQIWPQNNKLLPISWEFKNRKRPQPTKQTQARKYIVEGNQNFQNWPTINKITLPHSSLYYYREKKGTTPITDTKPNQYRS